MKKIFTTFLILALVAIQSNYLFAQNKITPILSQKISEKSMDEQHTVWIFFKDKGDNITKKLVDVEKMLPANAIKRRKKLNKNTETVATFYDIPVNEQYINAVRSKLIKHRRTSNWLNAISVEVSGSEIENIANFSFVKKIDILRKGIVNRINSDISNINFAYNPKSTNYNLNYGSSITQLEQINVPTVHDMGYDGTGVIICVMDAGFNNLEHQSFSSMNIIGTYDFVNDDENVDDEDDMGNGNHGTMTLSTIGGFYEGQLIGPAFGASYILAKTENTDTETTVEEDNWVAAMEWAENNYGPDVTSTSLGYIDFDDGTGYSASELDGNTATITIGADIAASLGILVVNSAGNSGPGATSIGAPADGDSVLAVGAVYADGTITDFSSMGPTGDDRIKPEVMAMGSGVVVANTSGNTYTNASGTSFSCPLTAGAAALLVQMAPNASNMEIIEALKMSADNSSNPNNEYGWGIINVYEAYSLLGLPQISHTELADTENFNGPYEINIAVTSQTDILEGSPILFYRIDGGSWSEVEMSILSKEEHTYTAEITGTGSIATYDYYFSAENENANIFSPNNAPTEFYTFSSINDTQAPTINHNTIDEFYINLWNNARVICELNDNLGVDTNNSYIEWEINGVSQDNSYFSLIEGTTFGAYINLGIVSVDDVVSYKIVVTDASVNQNSAVFPESGFHDFNITDRISFEQNKFSHNWIFEGDENWIVTSNSSQDGTYSALSGPITDNQSSSISIEFQTDSTGTISFYKKVSSEEGYDFLKFYINGNMMNEWAGDDEWSIHTYDVAAGAYNIKWEYSKDGSVSSEPDDCAWIDNITLPIQSATYNNVEKINETALIFPNPTQGLITVSTENTNNIIDIFNITGKKIYSQNTTSKISTFDFSSFNNGVYLMKIISGNKTIVKKFIIRK